MTKNRVAWIRFSAMDSSNVLLWVVFLLFPVLYLMISYNNRLAVGDDMVFFNLLNEKGMFRSIAELSHNKRYSSYFLFNLVFSWNSNLGSTHISLFIYHCATLLAFIGSSLLLLKTLFRQFCRFTLSFMDLFLYSLIFIVPVFFFVPQLIETWFWTIATTIYSAPLVAFLFGIYMLINEKKGWGTYLILFFTFLFIGGALETFAIVVLFIILLLLFGSYTFLKSTLWKDRRRKLVFSLVCLLIIIGVTVIGSGLESRFVFEHHNPHPKNTVGKIFY